MKSTDIGKTAGRVWRRLEKDGEMSPTALAKALGCKPAEVERAIGWLAREDKLRFSVDKRGAARISLVQE